MASQLLLHMTQKELVAAMGSLSTCQSLALIQIFVNASLACICYSRELLPYQSSCFQSRFIDDLKSWQSNSTAYHEFHDLDASQQPAASQEFKFIIRSQNDRANQILDLLEKGVFEAIERGLLEAVQFFVISDELDPMTVLESYTFTFSYKKDSAGRTRHVSSVELSSPEGFVFVDALRNFRRAIKALLQGLRDLPRLPRKKSLGMSLIYISDCPTEYQPQGFRDATPSISATGAVDWSGLWKHSAEPYDEFDTGFHRVSLSASNAKAFRTANSPTSSQEQDVNISKRLQAMQKTSSQHSGLVSTISQPKAVRRRQNAPESQESSQFRGPTDSRSVVPPRTSRGSASESSLRSKDLSKLEKEPSRPKKIAPNLSGSLKNRRQRNLVPEKLAELVVQACAMENNNRETPHYIFDPAELKNNKVVRLVPGDEVNCECQGNLELEDMLFCNLCGTWQHNKCYGFEDVRPNRRPAEHFCYSCLLLPKEQLLNADMPTRVRLRLALSYLFTHNHHTITVDTGLRDALHLSSTQRADEALEATLDRLLQEGYVSKAGGRTYHIVARKRTDAQNKYLDHLAGVWDHYEATKDHETNQSRYKVIQSAVDAYTKGRSYLVDALNPVYDEVTVKNAFGESVRRWGFYRPFEQKERTITKGLKRKASIQELTVGKKPRRKQSIGEFVNVDRLTPKTDASVDDDRDASLADYRSDSVWEHRVQGQNSETVSVE